MKVERCILHVLPLLCGCLASMLHSPAQSQGVLSLENFSERLSKDVPVSGRVLVGAVVLSDETSNAPASLVPRPRLLWRGATVESPKDPLCVTLASRDGQYYGEGKLSVATLSGLTRPVRIQGKHVPDTERHLRNLAPEQLAMLASTGDCRLGAAGGKTATVHVLDRRDTDAPAGQGTFVLLLMLNSMTYSLAVEASIPGIGTRQATCEALDDDQRNKAFNTRCRLTVPNTATEAELVIKRRRYERGFDPIRFNLAWSAL